MDVGTRPGADGYSRPLSGVKLNPMTNPFLTMPPVDEASLLCKIGDRLTVRQAALTQEGEELQVGSVYEVEDRVQYAWILRLVHGSGADHLRILNSKMSAVMAPVDGANGNNPDKNLGS